MDTAANTIKKKVNPSFMQSFINFITEYSFLTILILFVGMVILSVVVTIFYNNIPNTGGSGTFDNLYTIIFAILFVYIMFSFMGAETIIMGKKFDLGLGIYLGIIFFIAFVMGG